MYIFSTFQLWYGIYGWNKEKKRGTYLTIVFRENSFFISFIQNYERVEFSSFLFYCQNWLLSHEDTDFKILDNLSGKKSEVRSNSWKLPRSSFLNNMNIKIWVTNFEESWCIKPTQELFVFHLWTWKFRFRIFLDFEE